MEPELTDRIVSIEAKIDAMYATVEKLRKYFLWTGIITVALFILPLIGLMFVIPSFISSYTQMGTLDQTTASNPALNQVNELNSLLQ